MRLEPLRRRGTEQQRIRRIVKWMRRGRHDLIARHFPGVWKLYLRSYGHPFHIMRLL